MIAREHHQWALTAAPKSPTLWLGWSVSASMIGMFCGRLIEGIGPMTDDERDIASSSSTSLLSSCRLSPAGSGWTWYGFPVGMGLSDSSTISSTQRSPYSKQFCKKINNNSNGRLRRPWTQSNERYRRFMIVVQIVSTWTPTTLLAQFTTNQSIGALPWLGHDAV